MSDPKPQDQRLAAPAALGESQVDYLQAVSWSALRSIASAQEFATTAEDALQDGMANGMDPGRLLAVLKMQREALEKLSMGLFFARLYFAAAES
jgi:hypothetical protein